MEICCTKAGIRVLKQWASVGLVIPSVLLFWQIWWLCILVWAVAAYIACFSLERWAAQIQLTLSGAELRLQTGKLFRTVRRQPVWNLNSVQIFQTPLLKKAKSCILILYSAHSVWIIPATDIQQAEKISLLPGNGGNFL